MLMSKNQFSVLRRAAAGRADRESAQGGRVFRRRHLGAVPGQSGSKDFAHEQHTKPPMRRRRRRAGGCSVAAWVGWSDWALAVPGLGPSSPPAHHGGGLVPGSRGGWRSRRGTRLPGHSQYEAKRYEGRSAKALLISVHAEDCRKSPGQGDLHARMRDRHLVHGRYGRQAASGPGASDRKVR